jgi:hypothetical protein
MRFGPDPVLASWLNSGNDQNPGIEMKDDERAIQLRLLASAVIDAYENRDAQFTPVFGEGAKAIMFFERPEAEKDHPALRTGIWYERSHYESTVTPGEKKAKRTSQK